MGTHKFIGWGLIGAAGLLFAVFLLDIRWTDWLSVLVLIPIVALLSGLLGIPGFMVLQRRWSDLAGFLSGLVSIAVFLLLSRQSKALESWLAREYTDGARFSFLSLTLVLLPIVLSLWLHRRLRPIFEKWLMHAA